MSFDDYAKTWDTDIRINRAKIIADEIKNTLDICKDCSAMEFGCGTGLISFNLFDNFKSITLVDSSKGMIDILNSKIDTYKVNNMFPYLLDITNENSLNMKFDVIYNSMVMHHIQDTNAIIKNFHEMLNNDGYLCIVDLDEEDGSFHLKYPGYDGHNGFNQKELETILYKAGFKEIESKTFYHDYKIIDDKKVNYSLFLMKAKKI